MTANELYLALAFLSEALVAGGRLPVEPESLPAIGSRGWASRWVLAAVTAKHDAALIEAHEARRRVILCAAGLEVLLFEAFDQCVPRFVVASEGKESAAA